MAGQNGGGLFVLIYLLFLVDPSLFLPHGDRDFFVSNLVLPLIIAFIVCYGIISYF